MKFACNPHLNPHEQQRAASETARGFKSFILYPPQSPLSKSKLLISQPAFFAPLPRQLLGNPEHDGLESSVPPEQHVPLALGGTATGLAHQLALPVIAPMIHGGRPSQGASHHLQAVGCLAQGQGAGGGLELAEGLVAAGTGYAGQAVQTDGGGAGLEVGGGVVGRDLQGRGQGRVVEGLRGGLWEARG